MKNLLFIGLLLMSGSAFGQIKIDKDHFISLLEKGEYIQVLQEAGEIRSQEYGKCETIDYFIGKSYCGLGKKEKAVEWYSNMLDFYKLKPESRKFVEEERRSCHAEADDVASSGSLNLSLLAAFANMPVLEAGVRGKGAAIKFDCRFPPQTFESADIISEAEMESRLFYLSQENEALDKYKQMLGDDYNVKLSGRFIIITHGDDELNLSDVTQISESLEKTFEFYVKHFQIRKPDKLLTVYLLPNRYQLRLTAKKIHGITIPKTNIGYSNISDLSLLGVADKEHLGTMMHELFHLMVRTDIGDAPAWLDEGVASIYEQSRWQGEELLGDEINWRTDQLRMVFEDASLNEKVPSLEVFLESNWDEFDGIVQEDQCIGAINHAYARALMVYFQSKQKLAELFLNMKNRNSNWSDDFSQILSSVKIVEMTLEQDINSIEIDFRNWLNNKLYSR